MKIDKYPTVVWECRKARIVATLQGPVCEVPVVDKGEPGWVAADLGKHGQHVLTAYHALMQVTDCEPKAIPKMPVMKPAPFKTIAEMDANESPGLKT